jgi:hypothetical protein
MPTLNDPNNNPAAVLPNGYQITYAAQMDMAAHSADNGDAYTILYSGDPGGTDADILYMKNSTDMYLRIYKIKLYCTVDVEVTIVTGVTGTPTNTTTVTPVNALVGSGSLAGEVGDFYSRAGDLALTGGNNFDSLIYDFPTAGGAEMIYDYPGEIALMKNQALVFNNVTDPSANIRLTVYFYYHEPVEKP